jgi:hypothetical protein
LIPFILKDFDYLFFTNTWYNRSELLWLCLQCFTSLFTAFPRSDLKEHMATWFCFDFFLNLLFHVHTISIDGFGSWNIDGFVPQYIIIGSWGTVMARGILSNFLLSNIWYEDICLFLNGSYRLVLLSCRF